MPSYRPSAPPMYSDSPTTAPPPPTTTGYNYPPPSHSHHVSHQSHTSSSPPYSSPYPPPPPTSASPYGGSGEGYFGYNTPNPNPNPFPPGTDPETIRAFHSVDRDRSGFVDDYELQQALSSSHHRFNLSTIRLLMFLFKNPHQSSLRIGPTEFAALWSCLAQWRVIFERFDRDRSGKIDAGELREALYGLGYAVPPSVLQLLVSHYDGRSGRRAELDFDSFVECGMVIKGLTEKFKEKDPGYTGSATLDYESFMTMVLPFLVMYD